MTIPTNFAEFYAAAPKYCRLLARKFLSYRANPESVSELEQELLLHLATPLEDGRDRISTFDPGEREASEALFYNFVKMMCLRKYLNLHTKEENAPETLSIGDAADEEDVHVPGEVSMEWVHQHSSSLHEPDPTKAIFIRQFRGFVGAREPRLLPVMDAIVEGENQPHDGGYTMKRLRKLADKFQKFRVSSS